MSRDTVDWRARIASFSDDELLKFYATDAEQYRPEIRRLAAEEVSRRGLLPSGRQIIADFAGNPAVVAASPADTSVVEDALYRPTDAKAGFVRLGDLFLTEDGIFFISYFEFPSFGPIGSALGWTVGGAVGGFATAITESGNLEEALKSAKTQRSRDWGVPIIERFRAHAGSMFVPRLAVHDLQLQQGTIVVETNSQTLRLIPRVPEASTAIIAAFATGAGADSRADVARFGLDFEGVPPRQLLDMLIAEDTSRSVLDRFEPSGTYMDQLWEQFWRLGVSQQEKILRAAASTTGSFLNALRDRVRRQIPWFTEQSRFIMWGIGLGVALLAAGGIIAAVRSLSCVVILLLGAGALVTSVSAYLRFTWNRQAEIFKQFVRAKPDQGLGSE
jgi:hypothetical protein